LSESLVIDSPLRGWAMPKSYSGDLRERVIEAVEIEGASRREAAERFGVSVSSGVRWLQRWNESGSAAPKPRGGSVSPLEAHEERILALIAERPDLTLKETLVELLKRRIRTSRSALSRFFGRHGVTFKKKPASRRTAASRRRARAATLDTRARYA
jgi:transposase